MFIFVPQNIHSFFPALHCAISRSEYAHNHKRSQFCCRLGQTILLKQQQTFPVDQNKNCYHVEMLLCIMSYQIAHTKCAKNKKFELEIWKSTGSWPCSVVLLFVLPNPTLSDEIHHLMNPHMPVVCHYPRSN